MSFKDVAALNGFLADKTYIEGYNFSEKDVEVFKQFPMPDAGAHPHAYRWYIHIAALSGIPAAMASMAASAPAAAAPAKKEAKKAKDDDDDDDFDVFGDDDDEEEEASTPAQSRAARAAELKKQKDAETERLKQEKLERLAQKEKKQRSLCNLELSPYDTEQDLPELFNRIKSTVQREGLVWSEGYALQEVAFGIKKLIFTAVINMNLSMDEIIDEILEDQFPEEIQSMTMTSMSLL